MAVKDLIFQSELPSVNRVGLPQYLQRPDLDQRCSTDSKVKQYVASKNIIFV